MMIFIYGGGHLGRYVYGLLKQYFPGSMEVLGFIDDLQPVGKEIVDNMKVVGGAEYLSKVDPKIFSLVLGIGYSNLPARLSRYESCKKMGFNFINIVHPHASIGPECRIGEGNIILASAVIDQEVALGNVNFIDMNCSISHNSVIGDNNFLTVGFSSAGFVNIGSSNFIGMSSSVTDHVIIGDNNFISAGNIISTNIADSRKVMTVFQQVNLDRHRLEKSEREKM